MIDDHLVYTTRSGLAGRSAIAQPLKGGCMKRMIEVPLESGGSMLMEVEVDGAEQEGMVPAARPGEMAAKAKQTFEEALEHIKPGADAIVDKLRGISSHPDEISVTF